MGLTTEDDGPGRTGRPVAGYETVPLLAAGTMNGAGRGGAAVLRRRTARPSRRAVVYVHCLGDSFVPADLVGWYTDRGFHFYAADLRAVGGGPRGAGAQRGGRRSGRLLRLPGRRDHAPARRPTPSTPWWFPRTRPAPFSPRCGATPGGAASPWTRSSSPAPSWAPGGAGRGGRRAARGSGAQGRASPLLAGAQRRLRRGLDIACPVLVMCPAAGGHAPGGTGGLLALGAPGRRGGPGNPGRPPGHDPAGRARHLADAGRRAARPGADAAAAAQALPGRAGPLAQRLPVRARSATSCCYRGVATGTDDA